MEEYARRRLVEDIAGSLAKVSKPDVVERASAHFRSADREYGERLTMAVAQARG
jgi:catalase